MKNKYIVSLTTIPSRFDKIENTIDTLINQTLKPNKIILNIPKKYNLRFTESIPDNKINELKNKYINNNLIINLLDNDYGPGTKLIGLLVNNIIDINEENTYIVLLDDDLKYKLSTLENFNIYYKDTLVSSYFTWMHKKIIIGQGADCFFIKSNLLVNFLKYYNLIKNYDYINYHDDYYISYYFYVMKIGIIKLILPDKSLIYNKTSSSDTDSLYKLKNKYNRKNLNNELYDILTKLNNTNIFNFIKCPYKYLYIGNSININTKIITLDKEYPINTKIYFIGYNDRFSYKIVNNQLYVTRIDTSGGWQNRLIAYVDV